MSKLTIASKTDIGKRRAENQDSILVKQIADDAEQPVAHLLAVADGVGGGPAGQVASSQAVTALAECGTPEAIGDPPEALREGFQRANVMIQKRVQEEPGLSGMATTLTAAIIHNG